MARKKKKPKGSEDDESIIAPPNEWTAASELAATGGMALGRAAIINPPPKPSYIGPVFTILLCCQPLGILSLYYATQVPIRWKRGDENGSRYAAERSEFWMYAGVGAGILIWIVGIGIRIYQVKTAKPYG